MLILQPLGHRDIESLDEHVEQFRGSAEGAVRDQKGLHEFVVRISGREEW